VAVRAGVSKSTASRALNNAPSLSIRPETRQRIVKIAQQLNYQPHAAARGLRRAQTGVLSLVIPDILNPIYALISRGSVHRALEREFAVLITEDMVPEEADEVVVGLVQTGRVDGVIVASARQQHPLLCSLGRLAVPHVFVLRTIPGSGRNIMSPDEEISGLAADHLCDLGHSVIGHIAGPRGLSSTDRLVAGFRAQAMLRACRRAFVVESEFSERGGAQATEHLLSCRPRPTGLTTASVGQAAGALHAASKLGFRVPEDLSIVSCVDTPLVEFLGPSITAVSFPYAEMGAVAVDALIEQLLGGEPRDALVAAKPEMIVRASTGPPA
jgi:LacI family transcriptional regulator